MATEIEGFLLLTSSLKKVRVFCLVGREFNFRFLRTIYIYSGNALITVGSVFD
jgi:hypothetical protein